MGNIYNLDNEIKKHILIEFSKSLTNGDAFDFLREGRGIIFEKHGILPEIDEYWSTLFHVLCRVTPNKNNDYIITDNIFYDIEGCPFYGVYIKIHHTPINEMVANVKGGYNSSGNISEDGKIFLKMVFDVECPNGFVKKSLKAMFYHEITHAFEDYLRRKNKRDGLFIANSKTNYNDLEQSFSRKGYLENIINSICYMFNKIESNAYVSTARGEMEDKFVNVNNSKEAFDILKETFVWGKIKELEKKIELFLTFNGDGMFEKIILETWEKVTNEKFKSYGALKRILKGRYLKNCRHMMNQLSKLVYDLYLEYGEKNTIPSHMKFDL